MPFQSNFGYTPLVAGTVSLDSLDIDGEAYNVREIVGETDQVIFCTPDDLVGSSDLVFDGVSLRVPKLRANTGVTTFTLSQDTANYLAISGGYSGSGTGAGKLTFNSGDNTYNNVVKVAAKLLLDKFNASTPGSLTLSSGACTDESDLDNSGATCVIGGSNNDVTLASGDANTGVSGDVSITCGGSMAVSNLSSSATNNYVGTAGGKITVTAGSGGTDSGANGNLVITSPQIKLVCNSLTLSMFYWTTPFPTPTAGTLFLTDSSDNNTLRPAVPHASSGFTFDGSGVCSITDGYLTESNFAAASIPLAKIGAGALAARHFIPNTGVSTTTYDTVLVARSYGTVASPGSYFRAYLSVCADSDYVPSNPVAFAGAVNYGGYHAITHNSSTGLFNLTANKIYFMVAVIHLSVPINTFATFRWQTVGTLGAFVPLRFEQNIRPMDTTDNSSSDGYIPCIYSTFSGASLTVCLRQDKSGGNFTLLSTSYVNIVEL